MCVSMTNTSHTLTCTRARTQRSTATKKQKTDSYASDTFIGYFHVECTCVRIFLFHSFALIRFLCRCAASIVQIVRIVQFSYEFLHCAEIFKLGKKNKDDGTFMTHLLILQFEWNLGVFQLPLATLSYDKMVFLVLIFFSFFFCLEFFV